jgi:RND family efflux transporter MFP subunit
VAARLRLAEVDLARAKALFAKGTVPQGTLDRAQAERDTAAIEVDAQKDQASLAILEAQQAHRLLERRNLRSPFDGVVIARWISPGEYADRQRVLMIAKLDPLTIDIVVPAAAFGALKTGDLVQVTVPVHAKTVMAKIASVDPMIDAAGTFGARASLANPDNAIPAGSRCTAEIVSGLSP